jgi:hypothetical protein
VFNCCLWLLVHLAAADVASIRMLLLLLLRATQVFRQMHQMPA